MVAFFASEHPQQRKTNCNLTNAGEARGGGVGLSPGLLGLDLQL